MSEDGSYRSTLEPLSADARAAVLLADMFSGSVLPALDRPNPRRFLYCWERETLEWLKEFRRRDPHTPLCAWTSCYMRHGPPPWKDK